MGNYGTNLEGFGGFEGGVNADKGAPLVSTSSDGETSLLFGPAALREIQAGVANGDFAIPPDAAGDTITEENPLPYWTFTDVNSAGAITAAIVADAGAGSGNVLRFTVASGTLTGKSATLSRFIPVASSASRSFSFYAEATFDNGTNSTQANATLACQFYKADQTTTTGTAFNSATKTFDLLQTPLGINAPDIYSVAPDNANMTAPADAAYLKITITIATVATQSAARTVDLTEVRLAHGLPELFLTDKTAPATKNPAYITNENGELQIVEGTGDSQFYLAAATTLTTGAGVQTIGNFAIDSETITANVQDNILLSSGADITVQATSTVDITAPSGAYITTDGSTLGTLNVGEIQDTLDLNLAVGGGDVIIQDTGASLPRLLYRDSTGTFLGGIRMAEANIFRFLNGSSSADYAYLYAERIYPMNGTTASRYIDDDGTRTRFSGGITVTGDATATGGIGFDGAIYGTSALTGPNIDLGGTNARLWTHSSSAADVAASTSSTVSGVLITKATAGQPSTNINGTATTDAFADALRNGGIAVDTTNNRGYFYANGWKYAALTTPSDSRLKEDITEITGALDTLRQLVPVAFKWKRPEAHNRAEAVADDGTRLGFIADQVATTDLAHWVETLGVDEREADLVDTTEVLAVNIPQNEMEALVVQALLDIDARLKALEGK